MRTARKDEAPRTWFRSERVFLNDGKWFFHTREGIDVGPYESQFEADIEAGMLKERLSQQCLDGGGSLPVIRDFVLESYAMGRPLQPRFSDHLTDVN